jgi:hypothetical protein
MYSRRLFRALVPVSLVVWTAMISANVASACPYLFPFH